MPGSEAAQGVTQFRYMHAMRAIRRVTRRPTLVASREPLVVRAAVDRATDGEPLSVDVDSKENSRECDLAP